MYVNCVVKSRHCVKRKVRRYKEGVYIGDLVARSTGAQGRNYGCRRYCGYCQYCGYCEHCGHCRSDIADVADIANIADRMLRILRIIVEIGGRVRGVTGVVP